MSDWEWRTLGDIASSQGYGLVDGPFGSNLPASCYVESGIPVIRGSNLTLGTDRFVANEFVYVSEETASQLERSLARPSDIVFTKKGTIGQTGLIPNNLPYDVYLISSNQMKLTVDESVADPIFVYYYVSSKESQNKIKRDSEFTGVPKTNTKYLREFPIYLPPLQQQKQIAKTLDSLDRKIENLRRQNETLERIAQTLFKHWFVDFEFPNEDGKPYKSSGGEMVRSELGEIPASWRVGALGDVTATITKGTTPTTLKKQFQDSGINFVKAESITDDHSIDSSKLAYIDEETNQLLKRSILREKDVVYTIAGTIGRYAIVNESLLPASTNQAVAIIRPNTEKVDPEYLLCYFSSRSYQHYLSSRVVQAVQANLSLGILSESPIILPDKNTKMNFGNLAKPLFQKKEENQKQIQTLTKTRDVLLPKLMSGKLRITE